MHTHPTEGEPQYVAKPVLDLLFPPGAPARIPIVAVTGTNGKTTTVRMIAHVLKLMGRRVGMTSTDGIVVDGRLIKKGDMSGPKSAQMVLQNPTVDMAVFEVARGGIIREGLGYDRNDVAVVTNVTGDHLGLGGIDTIRQLASVKSVVVDAVPKTGTAVLNADDPLVARMARQSEGRVVLFSMATEKGSDGWDRVDTHCGRGGAAFVLQPTADGEMIVLRLGPRTMPVVYTHLIPATFGGKARMNVANALAAAAAAWAAGAHLHDIRQGLRTFTTSFFQAPGRLNLVEQGGVRLVIDYSHNVDGMRQLADFVRRMMEPAGAKGTAKGAGAAARAVAGPGDRGHRHPRATGATATSTTTATPRPARSTRSSSARTATCAAASPARRRATSWPGSGPPGRRARRSRRASTRSSTRRRRCGRRSGAPCRATSSSAASTTRWASTGSRTSSSASPAGRARSATRASSRRRPGRGGRRPGRRLGGRVRPAAARTGRTAVAAAPGDA